MSIYDIKLSRNIAPTSIPLNIYLNGIPVGSFAAATSGLIYWRFEDDLGATPQFLGAINPGKSLDFPIDLKGRAVRLFLVGITNSGKPTTTRIFEGTQTVFDPGAAVSGGGEQQAIAGVNLAVRDLVYFYDDSGVTKAAKADADDATKPCQGFVAAAATAGDPVRIFLTGNVMKGLSGLTPGAIQYLSTTAGAFSETPPATDGNYRQQIGVTIDSTSINFAPLTGTIVDSGSPPPGGSPPSGLSLTDLGDFSGIEHVQLNWTNNGGSGDNLIERNLDGTGYTQIGSVSSATATYTDTTATIASGGLFVSYRVRNANVAGYSNEQTIDDRSGSPPTDLTADPELIAFGPNEYAVHLNWTAGTGSGNYTVERKTGSGGAWSAIAISEPSTNFDDDIVAAGLNRTYYYRVKQNDVAGYSNEASAFIPKDTL